MTGIDELRACVRWADGERESWFDGATARGIVAAFRVCRSRGYDSLDAFFEAEARHPWAALYVREALAASV